MKAILTSIILATILTSCGTNWQALGQKVGQATADATLPIITDTIVTKPAPKQPVPVTP